MPSSMKGICYGFSGSPWRTHVGYLIVVGCEMSRVEMLTGTYCQVFAHPEKSRRQLKWNFNVERRSGFNQNGWSLGTGLACGRLGWMKVSTIRMNLYTGRCE